MNTVSWHRDLQSYNTNTRCIITGENQISTGYGGSPDGNRILVITHVVLLKCVRRTCVGCREVKRGNEPREIRFSVFAISIPRLRTHAGAVAGSRLVSRYLYSFSFCFLSFSPISPEVAPLPTITQASTHASTLLCSSLKGVIVASSRSPS